MVDKKYWGEITKQEKQKYFDFTYDMARGLYYEKDGVYHLVDGNIKLVTYIARACYEIKELED